ncbi:Molybdopterin cofactor biosynthesis C domain-containing protein [Chytridium lagenaria]|nr:Molybdopterin cofactor biosynthesis C domain-containing protein [Chytridium lagenaria]
MSTLLPLRRLHRALIRSCSNTLSSPSPSPSSPSSLPSPSSASSSSSFTSSSASSPSLSHVDASGKVSMVGVAHKDETHRIAKAYGRVTFSTAQAYSLLKSNAIQKGDVLTVSKIAGINAAKQAGLLIPLAHPLSLSRIAVDLTLEDDAQSVDIVSTVECVGRTGVEVEAMVAVSMTACTVFDMCKAVDKGIMITNVKVIHKSGGKSSTTIQQK